LVVRAYDAFRAEAAPTAASCTSTRSTSASTSVATRAASGPERWRTAESVLGPPITAPSTTLARGSAATTACIVAGLTAFASR